MHCKTNAQIGAKRLQNASEMISQSHLFRYPAPLPELQSRAGENLIFEVFVGYRKKSENRGARPRPGVSAEGGCGSLRTKSEARRSKIEDRRSKIEDPVLRFRRRRRRGGGEEAEDRESKHGIETEAGKRKTETKKRRDTKKRRSEDRR